MVDKPRLVTGRTVGLRPYYYAHQAIVEMNGTLLSGGTVARYDQEHKDATHRRIIEAAGRRLKREGIDGSGIATLMADAGLTNGAFYTHFASKENLVASVVEDELHRQASSFRTLPPGAAGLEQLVRAYLSREHRNRVADGCPSAALLDEIGRTTETVKRAYTAGVRTVVDQIATRLEAEHTQGEARGRALNLFTLIVGTIQLARAVADPELSDEVLANGLAQALRLLGNDLPS